MINALIKLTAVLLNGITHYAYGCICYNQMGMSPKESDAFVLSLLAPTPASESDGNLAKNRRRSTQDNHTASRSRKSADDLQTVGF